MRKKYNSGLSYYKDFTKILNQIPLTVERAYLETAKAAFDDVSELTSGTASPEQLAREGHPYGRGFTDPRGRPRSSRPRLPFNKDKGILHRSAYIDRRRIGGKLIYAVGFKLPAGDGRRHLFTKGGTKFMQERPIWDEVTRRHKARKRAVSDAFKRAVRG